MKKFIRIHIKISLTLLLKHMNFLMNLNENLPIIDNLKMLKLIHLLHFVI